MAALTKEVRITNLLSMAQRARRVASGAFAVTEAIKKREAKFLLVAEDAADESKKTFLGLADKYKVPYAIVLDRETLGGCLGKEYRAAAAVTDAGFAKKLQQLTEESV